MKAYLRSARIAPKKANIIAKLVRGMPVGDAVESLKHTHKKGARMVEELIKSAVANAEHNDKQDSSKLIVKTIVVNQSMGYRRGVPMARGRMRPMTKFMSHISLTLGVAGVDNEKIQTKQKSQRMQNKAAKSEGTTSQSAKNPVKTAHSSKGQKKEDKNSSESAASSVSSESAS